ncbi:hemin-degrading factor [Rosenbergiella sp. S61]|uniref:Hemin-degrading factor n=1 Tax=Rosenbergiella gaditana TaxID=2726987 RepID=A0ABS5SY51_9GAMM|nr:ChuX/HutX family heme-like substrate-binding protein [Rosenbergiella gaditana]MBT0724941.1 hemin-degrading factor [Rosenbergiella gaditana]
MNKQYLDYLALKTEHPHLYVRDLAAMMAISEAELTLIRCGHDALSLQPKFEALLNGLAVVGEIKSLVRNDYAVHEHIGRYENVHFGQHAGLVLNPRALDQRFFPKQWHSVFALTELSASGERKSLQIFDVQGEAVVKIYVTAQTDSIAWQALIDQWQQATPSSLALQPPSAVKQTGSSDPQTVEQEWRAMTDVHQFFQLLRRHQLTRQQAFTLVSDELAHQVSNESIALLLERVQQQQNEIMIFVGNRGCTQIFTGRLAKVTEMKGWLNIFNDNFTLHLQDRKIAETWITRKPTADGHVTSLELFAEDGTQIAQLYGQRTEGQLEQSLWRQQLEELAGELC